MMKRKLSLVLAGVTPILGAVAGAESVSSSVGSAFGTIQSDALATLAAVAPVGIAIMGAFLIWKLGVRFFKGLAK